MTEGPIVIEGETGDVIKDTGFQIPKSREQQIGTAAKKMAGAMAEEQQTNVLRVAHEVGLEGRRKLAVEAGKAQKIKSPIIEKPWWKFW